MGGICSVVNSKVQTWASSARINKVTLWPGLTLGTTAVAPEIAWFTPSSVIAKDRSMDQAIPGGVTVDKSIISRPPKDTLCGDWMNLGAVSAVTLFSFLNLSAGSVIDLDVTFTLGNNVGSLEATVVTGVLKTIYYLALDTPAGHMLTPTGVPTTF